MHHRYIGYIKIWGPYPSVPEDNGKFEILVAKVYSLKQKTNQILSVTLQTINCLFKKIVYGSFRQGITMEKCKTRANCLLLSCHVRVSE